jgi:KUP system potassium uptake protein
MSSSKVSGSAGLIGLTIGAIGVVYGDIGTSPLYAINEIFSHHTGFEPTSLHALQAISLVFWSLTLLICIEYITFVLRADHEGEGGVFALLALLGGRKGRQYKFLTAALLLSAGLLYGDGMITPAISVLSAIEGLKVVTTAFNPYIIPITLAILTVLFAFQYKGTARVGAVFGPIMVVWFLAIGALGLKQVLQAPGILQAINPIHAVHFLRESQFHTILAVLGSVMLVVTGGEALYADLGHFGAKPIRFGWILLVYPCLLLNYFGQGAYIYGGREIVASNLFFSLVPGPLLIPMVILATLATIIASQALITGVFSLTSQASALGLLPRFTTVHTHPEHPGQIYQPALNWFLYIGCVLLVLIFKSSGNLAAAYGLAVSALMCVTAYSMRHIARSLWGWNAIAANVTFIFFALFCFGFFLANSTKFLAGGYLPVVMGILFFIAMTTWAWGKESIIHAAAKRITKKVDWLRSLRDDPAVPDLPRAVVFLTSRKINSPEDRVPTTFFFFYQKYGAVPKHLLFFHSEKSHEAFVKPQDRFTFGNIAERCNTVTARFGFMEPTDVRKALAELHEQGKLSISADQWIIEVRDNETIISESVPWWFKTRVALFGFLSRIASPEHSFFDLGHDSGISNQQIPVEFSRQGVQVHVPHWELS